MTESANMDPIPASRMILAEDDDCTRKSLEVAFSQSGFDVVSVEDSVELLDKLSDAVMGKEKGTPPDVIVTDLRMPGFNVAAMIAGLRELGWTTPIFVITGYASEELRRQFRKDPHTRLFEKPLRLDELERSIARAVGQKAEDGTA